jgi:hypothetical protein
LLTLISIAVPWTAGVASAAMYSAFAVAQEEFRCRDFCFSLYQIKIL